MLYVNGEACEMPVVPTVSGLLQAKGLRADRVAVEQNGEIIRRTAFASAALSDGDRIEIVHFVGGG